VREKIMGALRWVRHLIGERAESAAETGDSVFQPSRRHPAVVVIADEIDETAKPEGASKVLEFLASKQRKAAVILILAGQRATATWTGGSGVRINLSTVLTGMLARDSESRHAVGAENEIPDIAGYSGGEAGFFQIWSTRAKRILARGRGFYIGRIGDQQREIISKRDPAGRPVLEGAGLLPETAPGLLPGNGRSGLRERLAHVRELNEDHPLPAARGPLPAVPGVPPEVAAGLVRVLARGPLSAAAAGLALGMSKSAAHRHLAALHQAGVVEKARGGGRSAGWQLAGHDAAPPACTTIAQLAEAVHDGLVPDVTDEQREVLEQVWQIAHRPRLTLLQGSGGLGQ
jgi:DNA-binding transcriptional ArsR family regulator